MDLNFQGDKLIDIRWVWKNLSENFGNLKITNSSHIDISQDFIKSRQRVLYKKKKNLVLNIQELFIKKRSEYDVNVLKSLIFIIYYVV